MFKEIFQGYKKIAIHSTLGRIATSIMVVVFISFMVIMVEFAIPSKDIDLIIKLGILYLLVNILRAIVTFWEDFSEVKLEKNVEADYREKIFVKLQNMKQFEIEQLKAGDILAMLDTGAYGYSMASNYNRNPRPAVVFAEKGTAQVVIKREAYDDLIHLDEPY